jgi:predicted transcriptional regulator
MSRDVDRLNRKIKASLHKDPGQTVKQLAIQLKVNRTFLAGYLKALEDQGYVRSKAIGPARVYFNESSKVEGDS